jgi:hypothetical protein
MTHRAFCHAKVFTKLVLEVGAAPVGFVDGP